MLGKLGTAPTEKSVKEHALDCLGVCNDRLADEVMRKELIDWEIDYLCHKLTMERVNAEIASNGVGNTSAMLKYYGTELNKRKHELSQYMEAIQCTGKIIQYRDNGCVQRVTRLKEAPPKFN